MSFILGKRLFNLFCFKYRSYVSFALRNTLMSLRMLKDSDWPLCLKIFLVNYPLQCYVKTSRSVQRHKQGAMARRYFLRLGQQSHGNFFLLKHSRKLLSTLYSFIIEFCKRSVRSCFCFLVLVLLKLVPDVCWSPSFTVWFLNVIQGIRERIEMYKDLNWSASLIVLFLSIQCFILFFYTCCKGFKTLEKKIVLPVQ